MHPQPDSAGDRDGVLPALPAARKGHFQLESGHHGDLWLDLDRWLTKPGRLRPFAVQLATRLQRRGIEAVCGPLTGGAFLAQLIASELDVDFSYAERSQPGTASLYPVDYRLPTTLRAGIRGKTVAVVDDVSTPAPRFGERWPTYRPAALERRRLEHCWCLDLRRPRSLLSPGFRWRAWPRSPAVCGHRPRARYAP